MEQKRPETEIPIGVGVSSVSFNDPNIMNEVCKQGLKKNQRQSIMIMRNG